MVFGLHLLGEIQQTLAERLSVSVLTSEKGQWYILLKARVILLNDKQFI